MVKCFDIFRGRRKEKEDSLRAEEAVRGGRGIHRSWRPLRGGTTSASAATGAPSRDFPTRGFSASARLTSAAAAESSIPPAQYDHKFLDFET